MATFLFKSEPSEYSWDDLVAEGRTRWDGIANNAALKHLRSAKKGDEAFIYHTGSQRAIVGLAQIIRDPYEDPENMGRTRDGDIKTPVIDIEPLKPAKTPVTLARIKGDDRFNDFALVRQSRLSVMPVPATLDRALRKMAGL